MIQQIKCLRVKLESILLRRRAWHRRRRGAIAATHPNHPDLRAACLLLFRPETLAPAHTRTDLPTRGTTLAVTSNAERPIVDDRVAVVIEAGGDVVREGRSCLEDRRDGETHWQSL